MREIKFRAYIRRLKWMVQVERICFDIGTVEVDLTDGNGDTAEYYFGEIELMQFTGLKDKNGIEIYEGDVVEATRYDGLAVTGVVDFRDCSFVISTGYQTIYTWIDYQIEVIGNIYENPELLKESKNE